MTRTPGSRWRGRYLALVAGALVLVTGCASDAPQDTFKPAGPYAQKIDNLARPVFYIAGVVLVLVFAAVLFVIFKFRQRDDDANKVPHQLHGNTKLEVLWTIAPAVLLVGVLVPTLATVFDLARKPKDPIQITALGQQWWWEFQYPGTGIVTSGEMVFPAGQTVLVTVSSRDVIHSFWFPRLNGKRDAVPGRFQTVKIQADKPGEYWGQCTEFCGLSHANMRMRAVALSPADWERWQANQTAAYAAPTDTLAKAGEAQFAARCASCHQINGLLGTDGKPIIPRDVPQVSGAAPNLSHLMSRSTFAGAIFDLKLPECTATNTEVTGTPVECLNRSALAAWLRNAPGQKPMVPELKGDPPKGRGMPNLNLTEQQIQELIAYLSTRK